MNSVPMLVWMVAFYLMFFVQLEKIANRLDSISKELKKRNE